VSSSRGVGGSANVTRLVYLAAFMIDADEELPGSLLGDCFPEFVAGVAFDDDGLASPNPEMTKQRSFQQASPEIADWAAAQLRPMAMEVAVRPPCLESDGAASHRRASCSEDGSIRPEVQRRWATERATDSLELPFDHCPQLSHPVEVAELLAKLATQ
jgi:hypothetical protein